jgi:murein tripeptide amidase MpaA
MSIYKTIAFRNIIFSIIIHFILLSSALAEDWQTYSEKSNYKKTPRYQETMNYFEKLARHSSYTKMITIGKSAENRELKLFIISKDKKFTGQKALKLNKPIVLIENCIHPGESEGKDACMLLARDLLIEKKYPPILDQVIILMIPILNVDGHEIMSPYNRLNQNGPEEMGWRVTATRHNLNRDFMKAETPEIRSLFSVLNEWQPHLFIDCHTTDGADFQYDIHYHIDTHDEYGGAVSRWAREDFLPAVIPACEQKGHILDPYAGLIDENDPTKGMNGGIWPARLSNPYITLRNRAGFLIETHALKDYKTRIFATYDLIQVILQEMAQNGEKLIDAVGFEDQNCLKLYSKDNYNTKFPLTYRLTGQGDSLIYHAYKFTSVFGKISGQNYLVYEPIPVDIPSIYFNHVEPVVSMTPSQGYLIPAQWRAVIDVLKSHGIEMKQLNAAVTDTFECYRFENPRWGERPYEGRHLVTFKTKMSKEIRTFPANTWYVPSGQRLARLVFHLLEPEAPDALIRWGYFNTIFEQKEYFEDYIMEPLAQKMLEKDSKLKAEFEARLASDSTFAKSPYQRLHFFYQRSPYWDREKDLYPIARVVKELKNIH